MVTKRKVIFIWLLWLIFWPVILWLSYHHYYVNIENHIVDISLFGLFLGIVAWFPITIKDNPVFFVNGISMAVFLIFGLFVEIILTLLAIVIVLLKIGAGKKDLYRYPLNMLMFSIVSVISAAVFNLLGGSHETISAQSEDQIAAVFGYAISIFLFNTLLNKLLEKVLYNRKVKIFDEGLRWEFISASMTIPVGFVLFVLYTEIGIFGIFYLGIPFVFISIILMLLYSYQEINRFLEKTGDIGHRLTNRMELTNVYDVFIQEISDLLPIDYAYIFMANQDRLVLERFEDVHHQTDAPFRVIECREGFSGTVLRSGKPLLYKNASNWSDIKSEKIFPDTESVLSLPVEYGDTVIGVVTLESKARNAFEKMHLRVMTILTGYLGVAVENAKNYETAKLNSEKDGLTNIYNFTYIERLLEDHFDTMKREGIVKPASLIILDLDHFKHVNDTYGHEAGNEILAQVAQRLKAATGNNGVTARYGGEEFVVFLPDFDLVETVQMAETLRSDIFSESFNIENHMLDLNHPIDIRITASIGVATYPSDCETPSELIRHADRAMYIGAKQKGRNRVAVYNQEALETS
ncbi:sensor domain-containing diguanylate cyclase [Lentibacillus sp. CBA3610]|uniref:sensor domain-containing diguanylate cyclase n=1 Tax=Lentibacillus sp. CBA3610 TaxID=2518176 RepID=UPI0015954444|nr:sensor domain-containing diguanylate cyclase [Lentibacillus sp. CBA3610]QKY69585.1 diguanylate cyclase [Lentibacillus sp. CBA3610]